MAGVNSEFSKAALPQECGCWDVIGTCWADGQAGREPSREGRHNSLSKEQSVAPIPANPIRAALTKPPEPRLLRGAAGPGWGRAQLGWMGRRARPRQL